MQKHLLFFMIAMVVVCHCRAQLAFAISNPIAVARKDELVMLKRTDIERSLATKIGNQHLLLAQADVAQPIQFVDEDNDKYWDKLVFLCSLAPNESKAFTLMLQPDVSPSEQDTVQRAGLYLKPLNADSTFDGGPAWENDKVAFYLNAHSGNAIGVFGKIVPAMILDTLVNQPNIKNAPLSFPGMYILPIAQSLGAGGVAIATQDANGKDTLIRLAGNSVQKATYQPIADGPLYAAFRVHNQWQIGDKPVTVVQEYRIWAGQYFYETKIIVTGAPRGAKLVTGIADFHQNTVDSVQVDNAALLYSFGKQSQNKDELGLALLLPRKNEPHFYEAPKSNSDVTETQLAAQNIIDGKPLTFRFYACWSKTDAQFSALYNFKQFIKNEALAFSEALVIK